MIARPLRWLFYAQPLLCLAMIWISDANANDDWPIEVDSPSREVIVSNKVATHYATDTGSRQQRSYAGLYTSMHESLDDYVLRVDGRTLEPADGERAVVWPWLLLREYGRGLTEEILLPDGLAVLLVRLSSDETVPREWSVTPRVDMRWIWETPRPRYESIYVDGALAIRRAGWSPGPGAQPWLAVASTTELRWEEAPADLSFEHPRDAARKAMERTFPHEPGTLHGAWPAGATHVDVAFALGQNPEQATALARGALAERDDLLAAKRTRIEMLVAIPGLSTGDARLDKAYRWARASMDVLLMQTRGAGIYAGFHWFPNYWGRDTFICLPGACLVTDQLDTAREVLRSFLDFQLVDRSNPRFGRLPNIVQPDQLQYAGVDGTWWYVRAAYRYVQARRLTREPDERYERELWSALRMMIEGAERWAVDELGFLRHGDGETWMDAGGEQNPYSPRGNRAVEVQALYYNGLRVAEWLGAQLGDEHAARDFGALAERTGRSFARHFWLGDEQMLADHLDPDGTADYQIRPNAILALFAVEDRWPALLEPSQVEAVVDLAWRKLVKPWGVLSLAEQDPQFHPRHLDLGNYYYDAAYHNGDVWYWLSGPMIQALCRVGRIQDALSMLEPLVAETLDHGAVGAIREIRDGADTGTIEEFGGATFQAWSMAEMIRALHEDLGPALDWTERPSSN